MKLCILSILISLLSSAVSDDDVSDSASAIASFKKDNIAFDFIKIAGDITTSDCSYNLANGQPSSVPFLDTFSANLTSTNGLIVFTDVADDNTMTVHQELRGVGYEIHPKSNNFKIQACLLSSSVWVNFRSECTLIMDKIKKVMWVSCFIQPPSSSNAQSSTCTARYEYTTTHSFI
mmetsp:Transcript_32244/g.37878  ORF Transcript_32244/g.37878 Transcript_32244/m.37878 type:complete len:176 (+) Transcript_32244:38-565(+)